MSYIDRNAIGIGYADRNLFTDPAYADGWNAAIEILENTPDADVEPIRHGEWIFDEQYEVFTCSECGSHTVRSDYYPFCAFCGAKMDKEET